MPEGAFYAFADVRGTVGDRFKSSADVADVLLKEAQIVVTDGEGFGADGFREIVLRNLDGKSASGHR